MDSTTLSIEIREIDGFGNTGSIYVDGHRINKFTIDSDTLMEIEVSKLDVINALASYLNSREIKKSDKISDEITGLDGVDMYYIQNMPMLSMYHKVRKVSVLFEIVINKGNAKLIRIGESGV